MVQPSKALYGASMLFQKKQDGSLQKCVDYQALNKVTIKNKYPISLAAELFDRFSKAEYFTKLDLRFGYWQGRMAEGDEAKTTCVTRYGSFEFLAKPIRLTNALMTFCNLMNDVLFGFLDSFVVVYFDNIVIYSPTLDDHLVHLEKVLLPRFGKLLQKIHQGLFQGSMSTHESIEEREEVEVGMGCKVPSYLPKTQECDHLRVGFEIA